MKRSSFGIGVVCLTLLATHAAWAQPGRPGGGRAPGMGGGLDAAMLLRSEQVQEEINLTEEQKKAIEEYRAAQREGMRGQWQGFRDASPEERREAMEKMREQMAERAAKAREELAKILKPEQMKRLAQIRAQQQGVRLLLREEIQSLLGLTDDQKEQLGKIADEAREKMQEMFHAARGEGGERGQLREKMKEMRADIQAKSMAVLTTEQKEQLSKEVLGKPFELDRASLMGRRPGGEGRPQRGEGGRGRGQRGGGTQ